MVMKTLNILKVTKTGYNKVTVKVKKKILVL